MFKIIFYFVAAIFFIGILYFEIAVRFMQPNLSETQLFLQFFEQYWVGVPTLICGIVAVYLQDKVLRRKNKEKE